MTQPQVGGPAPGLGEHGRDILPGAGFSRGEIELLVKRRPAAALLKIGATETFVQRING
ncbi:hypothetical protein [Bradyrhizobium niftali]|uniref:hypothetical protein n=1 Tax=Bradyrhizobium niftali TaxID=2560055 RepID=UPI00142FAD33|nr:hypothetical protein [Bradyrhizobium niftali]